LTLMTLNIQNVIKHTRNETKEESVLKNVSYNVHEQTAYSDK